MNAQSDSKRLLVIGGADGMGMWMVKRVFAHAPDVSHITLADVKPLYRGQPQQPAQSNPDCKHIDEIASIKKSFDAVRLADNRIVDRIVLNATPQTPSEALPVSAYQVVMLAVPEQQFKSVSHNWLPQLQPGAAVFDVTSTKGEAMALMSAHAVDGVSVLGMHPLFGPAVPDAIGQRFVIVRNQRTDSLFCTWVTDLLRCLGGIIETTTAATHDQYMLLIQTLTHYTYLVFGKALADAAALGYNVDESFRFATPPYNTLIAFTARIIGGNPGLYARIQEQPGADRLRHLFINAANQLDEELSHNDPDQALQAIGRIVEPFRGSDVARAYADSITLVDSVQQNYRDLFRHKALRQLTIIEVHDPLEQRATARLHVGLITELAGNSVVIEKRQLKINNKWYLAHDQESTLALQKIGKHPRHETVRILRRNIRRRFSPEETRQWRIENLHHYQRDLAVLVDQAVDMEHICAMLVRTDDALVAGSARAVAGSQWLQHYGMHNMLLRMSVFGDRDPEKCIRRLIQSLSLFGIRVRAAASPKSEEDGGTR